VKWSWRIARIAGIDVRVHATFWVLLAFFGYQGYLLGGRPGAAAQVGFVLLGFSIVVMHEYGHALTARRYGIGTDDITLLPIGGVARLERMPTDPTQEIVIALAGPAVNVVLAALIYAALRLTQGPAIEMAPVDQHFLSRTLLERLLSWNVMLAAFNMIPAFPLDGGRVLRALLVKRNKSYARGTVQAAKIGRFLAVLLGAAGYFGLFGGPRPTLILIALFIWLAAASEADAAHEVWSLEGVPLERVMITDVRTLTPTDPLSRAVELTLSGFQQDFPVVDGDTVVGVLTRKDLMRVLAQHGEAALVATAMKRDFKVADPSDAVADALATLESSDCHALPVVHGRKLMGVLTLDNVGEYMMIQAALRRG
jgi:Zn-dependent protease/predicted transcriptional regulator